jgi:hypothetical protein
MKNTLTILLALSWAISFAQEAGKDPKTTEMWKITPPVVTAGKTYGEVPSDAEILFDGKDLNNWVSAGSGKAAAWDVRDGAMTVTKGAGDIKTKKAFGDCQLHIEWRTPAVIESEGQGRGNSGIFFMEKYELQVLDSYQNTTYPNGQAGSIYKQHIPLVNASRKPGEWQTYDVIFTAPRFSETGRVAVPARITVLHNGIIIQNNVEIWGPSEYIGLPVYLPHESKGFIRLQDHGNPVSYRNIWIRNL